MIITIQEGANINEYYDVPNKVGKAIKVLLNECANEDTEIITAESKEQT